MTSSRLLSSSSSQIQAARYAEAFVVLDHTEFFNGTRAHTLLEEGAARAGSGPVKVSDTHCSRVSDNCTLSMCGCFPAQPGPLRGPEPP